MVRPARPEEADGVLRRQHPGHEHQGRVAAFAQIRHRGGEHAAAIGVVAAVEPDLAALRGERGQAPFGQALQARLLIDSLFDAEGLETLIAICGDFNSDSSEVPLQTICGPV